MCVCVKNRRLTLSCITMKYGNLIAWLLLTCIVISCASDRHRYVIFLVRSGGSWNRSQLGRIETELSQILQGFGLFYNHAFVGYSESVGRSSIAYSGKIPPLSSSEKLQLTSRERDSFESLEKRGSVFVSFNRTSGRICVTQSDQAVDYHPHLRRIYEQIEAMLIRLVGPNGYQRIFTKEGLMTFDLT